MIKSPGGFIKNKLYFGIHGKRAQTFQTFVSFDGKIDKNKRNQRIEERQHKHLTNFDIKIRNKLFDGKTDRQVYNEIEKIKKRRRQQTYDLSRGVNFILRNVADSVDVRMKLRKIKSQSVRSKPVENDLTVLGIDHQKDQVCKIEEGYEPRYALQEKKVFG